MPDDNSVESLFKEHSFEEIESVRDNLASEIGKRTELLKSIVKEKYRDIVETSDAIQSIKINLKGVEKSLWELDHKISEFYVKTQEPRLESRQVGLTQSSQKQSVDTADATNENPDLISSLLKNIAAIWRHFDDDDLKSSVKLYHETLTLLEENKSDVTKEQVPVVNNIEATLNRAKEMMKNHIWYKIRTAGPEQTGVIDGCEMKELFRLSLESSIDFLVETLRKNLSDTSFQAQLKRNQPVSFFNSQKNQVEVDAPSENLSTTPGIVQIPKFMSPELNTFLYETCRVINTIAGFNLDRLSIVESLSLSIERAMGVYKELVQSVGNLTPETRRKRAMQLYFDLLYLRILLNTSKSIELIEKLDPRITKLANEFEVMLDSIELYMISAALHENVMHLSRSTIRLFGLLIPHLQ